MLACCWALFFDKSLSTKGFKLNDRSSLKDMELIFGLTPSLMSRSIWESLRAINDACKDYRSARIKWPSPKRISRYRDLVSAQEPLAGAVGLW
jgi:hypothetical protein